MANYWAQNGKEVAIITLASEEEKPFYELHPEVHLIELNIKKVTKTTFEKITENLKRVKVLRKAIADLKPDVLISFMDKTNILAIMANMGKKFPLIMAERNNPQLRSIGKSWSFLRKRLYKKADLLTIQTEGSIKHFESLKKVRVIPNIICTNADMNQEESFELDQVNNTILAMGRFVEQKGFDSLIHAFSLVSADYPVWKLVIWGEGAFRKELEALLHNKGLNGRVFLPGITSQPYQEMKKADIFVLSSRYEGFPNVLSEAMACGLPAISTNCPYGPSDLIENEKNGILVDVDDIEAMAKEIRRLIENEKLRRELGQEARRTVEKYSIDIVMGMWENAVREVLIK